MEDEARRWEDDKKGAGGYSLTDTEEKTGRRKEGGCGCVWGHQQLLDRGQGMNLDPECQQELSHLLTIHYHGN